jgi:putative FmdB family regulatory protein
MGEVMPTYDFMCLKCGVTLEVVQSFSETTSPRCTCGEQMRKQYTAIPVHFKGTGWGKD